MQQIQYFKSAWGDIKNSPGWFGKLCLLALINFIPIFGQIVTFGYLYGWAREIAWGTHEPMPTRIFSNEDGKLYRRGWFILVLVFVAALVPSIVMQIGAGMQGAGVWGVANNAHAVGSSIVSGLGLLVYLVGLVGALLLSILAWIGSMRISIYDRLSAGFQLGKIWKMFRYDTNGVMRIFGMNLLVGFIIGIVISIIAFFIVFVVVFVGVAGLAASGYNVASLEHMSAAQATTMFLRFIASAGVVGFVGMLLLAFIAYLGEMFVMSLVARAMGYWTMQFEVPKWRGQDDPMPFETAPPAANVPPAYPVAPVVPVASTPAQAPQAQQTAQMPYGAYPQQQPTQPVQSEAPVPPSADVTPEQYWQSSPFEAPAQEEAPTAPADVVDEAVEEVAEEAAEPEQDAQPTQPAIEPGQLSGFTYTGVSTAPQEPVSPTGADPSEPTTPDLLVVIPETPADEVKPEEE